MRLRARTNGGDRLLLRCVSAPATAIAVLSVTALVAGCAAFNGVPPSDLSTVHVGVQRNDVDEVLGEPVHAVDTGCGRVVTYAYDRGAPPLEPIYSLAMLHPAAPLVVGLIAHPLIVRGQRGALDIAYDPDDAVLAYAPTDEREWPTLFEDNRLWYEGDAVDAIGERYYRAALAHWRESSVAHACLCRSAHMGHAGAQLQLARLHRLAPAGADDARTAYVWYAVAERHGAPNVAAERSTLADRLGDAATREAERDAALWQPDPARCLPPSGDTTAARSAEPPRVSDRSRRRRRWRSAAPDRRSRRR